MSPQRPKASMTGGGCRARRPSAYTLMELMIVLAILAGVAAVSWPALMRPWSRSLAQQAAQQFSTELLETRTRAVEESRVYRLRWRPGGSEFEIDAPLPEPTGESPNLSGRAGAASTESTTQLGDTRSTIDSHEPRSGIPGSTFDSASFRRPTPFHTLDQLEHGVRFRGPAGTLSGLVNRDRTGELLTMTPPQATATAAEGNPQSATSELASADFLNWSEPVWFYPDGRTSNGRWTLVSEDGYQVEVVLRGLTGTVRVHRVRRVHPSDVLDIPNSAAENPGHPARDDAAVSRSERPATES